MSIFLLRFDSFRFSFLWDDFVCVLAEIVQLICWSGRVRLSFFHSILWIVFQDCPAVFFYFVKQIFVSSTTWNWLFQWPTSLKKMISELTYGTLNFMNIYLLKVNSVHLSSAKHICPNSWLLVLSFWFWILILGSFPFVPPPPNIARASLGCN